MRTIFSSLAKLVALASIVLLSAIAPTPSFAHGMDYGSCHWKGHWPYIKLVCKKNGSRDLPDGYIPQSTELFPSRCNGELGFWEEPVVFQNGETFCIARSTADFYHNGITVDGGTTPTCTKTTFFWWWKSSSTKDGACPTHHNPD
jgi:hypothetical protein